MLMQQPERTEKPLLSVTFGKHGARIRKGKNKPIYFKYRQLNQLVVMLHNGLMIHNKDEEWK